MLQYFADFSLERLCRSLVYVQVPKGGETLEPIGANPIPTRLSPLNLFSGRLQFCVTERLLSGRICIAALCLGGTRACLHIAVKYGRLENATYLIKNGAKVNAKNQDGDTPLHIATSQATLATKVPLTL